MINLSVLQSMLSTTEIRLPTPDQIKTLTLTDLVIMNKLSVSLREQIKKYIDIDPFTTDDPFNENDDYEYSVILDKTNTNRVVCILATKKRTYCSIALGNHTWQSISTSTNIKNRSCRIET